MNLLAPWTHDCYVFFGIFINVGENEPTNGFSDSSLFAWCLKWYPSFSNVYLQFYKSTSSGCKCFFDSKEFERKQVMEFMLYGDLKVKLFFSLEFSVWTKFSHVTTIRIKIYNNFFILQIPLMIFETSTQQNTFKIYPWCCVFH